MVIDSHTHVWPDKIAERAIGGRDHGLTTFGDGTVSGLAADMARHGVDRSVIFGIAERPEHVDRANEFVGSQDRSKFIPFGTVHVELSLKENIAALHRHQIQGIKLHPLYQGFALNDPRLWDILRELNGELPVLAHVGLGGTEEANARCTPEMIIELAQQLPELKVIAAHFGGYRLLDQVEKLMPGLPLYLETSWPPTVAVIEPEQLRRLIEKHGADRIIFGSDWPMADPGLEIAAIRRLNLPTEEERAILGGNLASLVGIHAESV